ncbi:MAG: hypothetical protein DRO39_03505 [Thermoprotei archaeon]|nr:MAG: hypothetical protein DRO39_03505 [Thermoprotei archaeon]
MARAERDTPPGPTRAVRVPEELWRRLWELKEELGLRSLGDAARILLGLADSPLAAVALVFDLRSDVKSLVSELRRLNRNMERLMEEWEAVKKLLGPRG